MIGRRGMKSKLNYLIWMSFKGRGGGILTTSNPSFLILPNWKDLEGE